MKTRKDQSGFASMIVILITVVLAVGAAGWFVWQKNKGDKKSPAVAAVTAPAASAPIAAPAVKSVYDGWKEYCSAEEKSCFKYPSGWTYTTETSDFSNRTTFTSPSGSKLLWTAAISGLGGACDPDTQPHVFDVSVTPITAVPSFYVLETGDSAANATSISVRHGDTAPKLGDTGDCLDYSYFTAKNSTLDGALAAAGLSANYADVKAADKADVKNILLSYHY